MTPEQKQRIEQIRERVKRLERAEKDPHVTTWDGAYYGDVYFLLSLVKSQEVDDGSADWCDDCHGYTHKYDCPSKRCQAGTPLVDRVVDAVYRSMARYESGEWWLDTLKAKARVKRLLAESDAATPMRSACVAKLRQIAADYDNVAQPNTGAAISKQALLYGARQLESVSIQEQEAHEHDWYNDGPVLRCYDCTETQEAK